MRITLVLSAILLFLNTNLFSQNQIVGKWLSQDKKGITEIYKLNGKYYGKIVWLKDPNDTKGVPITDTKNPDISLRKRPIIGLLILKDFYYINNQWQEGTIYDPERGRTFNCKLWITDNNSLHVRGYWGFLTETQVWMWTK